VWGTGQAKHVKDFFHEIYSGECEPLTDVSQRVLSVVKVRITCEDSEGVWALYETKQKFCRDGRVRDRNRPLAEKKRPDEEPAAAALRGVVEELGSVMSRDQLEGAVASLDDIEQWDETNFSSSFPGLMTRYRLWMVDVCIDKFDRSTTGDKFQSVETPELSTGKVHTWQWRPFGALERARDLTTMLKARYPAAEEEENKKIRGKM